MPDGLTLQIHDYEGPDRWRWVLASPGGAFLADHQVELDRSWQREAFEDLYRYRRRRFKLDELAKIGRWVTDRAFGDIASTLTGLRMPVVVTLKAPPDAHPVACLPWGIASVDDRSLAARRIQFIVSQAHTEAKPAWMPEKAPIDEALRVLGLFSLPHGSSALHLRKERNQLVRLLRETAAVNDRRIHWRMIQYGVTRARLREILLDGPGWDVVHISAHGSRGGLMLERDDGSPDFVDNDDLVELLGPLVERVKFVLVSSCFSGALTHDLHRLGMTGLGPPMRSQPGESRADHRIPSLAAELAHRLDCAVLGMRYPVDDDFVIGMARRLYELCVDRGQPMAKALGALLAERTVEALPALTPILFGEAARTLDLTAPPGRAAQLAHTVHQRLARFPEPPSAFVGRVTVMAGAGRALAPSSGYSGVLLHGMPGIGKTTCAVELAHTHAETFPIMVWHELNQDLAPALREFLTDLRRQVKELDGILADADPGDQASFRYALPALTQFLRHARVMISLDGVDALLTATGWRDRQWEALIKAMVCHTGSSRLVMTARRLVDDLGPGVLCQPVYAMSRDESVLLARETPRLATLIDGIPATVNGMDGRRSVARLIEESGGHPGILVRTDPTKR